MKTQYLALLEAAIQKWADDNCDDMVAEDNSAYWYPRMTADMAHAAAAIYDAVAKGQAYEKAEGK